MKSKNSATGNRTLVSCVTGRDTSHYTIADQVYKTLLNIKMLQKCHNVTIRSCCAFRPFFQK